MSEFTDAVGGGPETSRAETRKGPLWRGPEVDGITFSLLSRFLACRERFRLRVVEGLVPRDRFNHRLEFGNFWHACEEAVSGDVAHWEDRLVHDVNVLCKRYPMDREEIANWAGIVRVMFPLYVEHWSKHPDVLARRPLLSEQVFSVPYRLTSGRAVRLRGKWDSVDLVGGSVRSDMHEGIKRRGGAVWLQENKTKGRVDERLIVRQLSFDLQTMLYLVALQWEKMNVWDCEAHDAPPGQNRQILGVRYNVVRRPAQYQGKKETRQGFLDRLAGIVAEDPGSFFKRWNVTVTAEDVARFRRECLDPILEQLCDWWDWIKYGESTTRDDWRSPFSDRGSPSKNSLHWRHPYGVYNPLDEGLESDLDGYLSDGSETGLTRTGDLFPELKQ